MILVTGVYAASARPPRRGWGWGCAWLGGGIYSSPHSGRSVEKTVSLCPYQVFRQTMAINQPSKSVPYHHHHHSVTYKIQRFADPKEIRKKERNPQEQHNLKKKENPYEQSYLQQGRIHHLCIPQRWKSSVSTMFAHFSFTLTTLLWRTTLLNTSSSKFNTDLHQEQQPIEQRHLIATTILKKKNAQVSRHVSC